LSQLKNIDGPIEIIFVHRSPKDVGRDLVLPQGLEKAIYVRVPPLVTVIVARTRRAPDRLDHD
jgi:hypothetical protein